jgi:hypothetical protein
MKISARHSLVFSLLLLSLGLNQASAQTKPNIVIHPPPPLFPLGIYAVVPVEAAVAAAPPPGVSSSALNIRPDIIIPGIDAYLTGLYSTLLDNPAVSGLALQVQWATLNPNPLTDPNPYYWNYVDDAFASVNTWNLNNPSTPKTIQLIVSPGFYSPPWLFADDLTSCDGLFASPPVIPPSSCGYATFSDSTASPGYTKLPMPWNLTYQAAWKTFLTALAARYSNPSFVSIAVAGPTSASVEMILPHTDADNSMWDQLLTLQYPKNKSYHKTDQAFIDAWNSAIDMYSDVFIGVTLVVTTGNGLPNLATDTPYTPASGFASDCANDKDMDCQAETTILSHFVESSVGGFNGKATQTSGMEASRVKMDLGVDGVKSLTLSKMTKGKASTRILGGAQFNTSFSNFAVKEGCTSTFPPTSADAPAGCVVKTWKSQGVVPVSCIPTACLAPGVTTADLATFKTFGKVPASDLISPEQALYNVLEQFFTETPVGSLFGGTTAKDPLNYLQIYYPDIQYATDNAGTPASVIPTSGPPISETAQTMLNYASTELLTIDEIEP